MTCIERVDRQIIMLVNNIFIADIFMLLKNYFIDIIVSGTSYNRMSYIYITNETCKQFMNNNIPYKLRFFYNFVILFHINNNILCHTLQSRNCHCLIKCMTKNILCHILVIV